MKVGMIINLDFMIKNQMLFAVIEYRVFFTTISKKWVNYKNNDQTKMLKRIVQW